MRTYLVNDAGERVFGPGPAELLRRVREHGSLRVASASMGMAYTKALALVRNAEAGVGVTLTTRVVGGVGGGGSTPTPEADALLRAYERWTASVEASAGAQFAAAFADEAFRRAGGADAHAPRGATVAAEEPAPRHVGVAVLAAGHARRFGSNKLMEPLLGEPVLARTLGAIPAGTEMVVASGSAEVDALVDARGIARVRPEGSLQSDSLRALAAYASSAGWDACVFLPGDQPLVEQESLRTLMALSEARPDACVRLSWRGGAASPALFPSSLFDRLSRAEGDRGGSSVLGADDALLGAEARWPWELWDVDTPSDLVRVREIMEAGLGRGAGE